MLCFWENGSRARRPTPAEVSNNLACSPSTLKIRRRLHGGESSGSNHAPRVSQGPESLQNPNPVGNTPLAAQEAVHTQPGGLDRVCRGSFRELWGARKTRWNSSGRRARGGGWERPERRRCWTGQALLLLRSAVKHPLRISPSRPWFALEVLCQVEPVLPFEDRSISHVLQTFPQEYQAQTHSQNPDTDGEGTDLHCRGISLLPDRLNSVPPRQRLENDPGDSQGS